MESNDTNRRLANITDGGMFERLATAVLRKSEYLYSLVSHPGVNAEGKTIKSPVDGIAIAPGSDPPHIIIVHHTVTAAKDLSGKWLHDPAAVKTRSKGGKPTEPAGDVTKTAILVASERIRTPNLKATLVLTTNQDPDQETVRNVHAAGFDAGLAIDIWPRSRIADFLDNNPDGQWLRLQYLGINQERISADLLREISDKSLQASAPPDDPDAWVERELDRVLATYDSNYSLFLIAESGRGKSVACYKRLRDNLNRGAFSLVLSDDIVAQSITLDQAIEEALCNIHPTLAPGCGAAARKLGIPGQPLLITVEDINRSGRGVSLIERIARWSESATTGRDSWQIICPIWPQVMSSLPDEVRKKVSAKAVFASALSKEEGALAVQKRQRQQQHTISQFDAIAISEALGRDPLLIALHDPDESPTAEDTISQFIESSLQRLWSVKQEYSPAEYRNALRKVAKYILILRKLNPDWLVLLSSPELSGHASALRQLVQQGEVIRISGHSGGEQLAFRHDRVREWVLADGFGVLLSDGEVADDLTSDPFYAEIIGLALSRGFVAESKIQSLIGSNPLAGFCALRHMHIPAQAHQQFVIDSLKEWLRTKSPAGRAYRFFRWEAARMLAECENPHVLSIAEILTDHSWNMLRARFRNGDLMGGIALCYQIELGTQVVGLEKFIEHVKQRYGSYLTQALAAILSQTTLPDWERIGALRLSGHLADPALADSVKKCWEGDAGRINILSEYLWALAQCSSDPAEAVLLLKPACDLWASLPDKADEKYKMSPRLFVVEYGIRWAFQQKVPKAAIPYFIERARSDDLKWLITYIFEGVDHPDAIEFLVRELGKRDAELEGSGKFLTSSFRVTDTFVRRQKETGRGISESTLARLVPIWRVESEGKHIRRWAFRFWSATKNDNDLDLLRFVMEGDDIFDLALWQRIRRRDYTAVPALLKKLSLDKSGYWWQLGREFWSDEMTEALDAALARRSKSEIISEDSVNEADRDDWILSEMIINLSSTQAEKIILKHWQVLKNSDYYIMAALFVATPPLLAAVAEAVSKSDAPQELFKYLTMRSRRTRGVGGDDTGFYKLEQVEALIPYIDYLSDSDIHRLWDACNKNRWYNLRKEYFDKRISEDRFDHKYLTEAGLFDMLDDHLKKSTSWVDIWVDRGRESGWTLDQMLGIAAKWCAEKKTIPALEILASVLAYAGTRAHSELIDVDGFIPSSEVEEIKSDTLYKIYRRSIM